MICQGCAQPLTAFDSAVRVSAGVVCSDNNFESNGDALFCRACSTAIAQFITKSTQPGSVTAHIDQLTVRKTYEELLRARKRTHERGTPPRDLLLPILSDRSCTTLRTALLQAIRLACAMAGGDRLSPTTVSMEQDDDKMLVESRCPRGPATHVRYSWSQLSGAAEIKIVNRLAAESGE